ncbi:hypothetical protein NNJEOMEG_02939 [Fundidesulfovibrio magnetotacticus]|uniref:Lipoprotein n=1 Tax=Fundidesulfovibrio magnetotacticus TaxID=2730080 RepID=A0A6V8M3N8_9BACT|nr:hypothetical protein [Fundidesulfovibrio magnetotacticus]GFK95085.1 hypothetical protein NNJEOMEG_02939 [Fundidesulfovibrio magnetotacticus]
MLRKVLPALLLMLAACKPDGPPFTNVDLMAMLQQEDIYLQEGLAPLEQQDLSPAILRRGLWPITLVMFFAADEFPVQLNLEIDGTRPGVRVQLDVNGQRVLENLPVAGRVETPFRTQKGLNVLAVRYATPQDAPRPGHGEPVTGFKVFEVVRRGG